MAFLSTLLVLAALCPDRLAESLENKEGRARKGHKVLLLDKDRFPSDTLSTHMVHPPGHRPLARVGVGYGPRRTILDKLLVDAAAEAGAEVREHFTVEEILVEDGRVTGVRAPVRAKC